MLEIARKSINRGLGTLFIDRGQISDTVFLAGSGRSGTTWLEEILNHDNAFRAMFEPFHARMVDIISNWNYRQYLRPENRGTKFLGPATTILSGAIHHPWIDQYNRQHFPKKRLIKDIRANLLLKWIKANFPEIPIIFLIRHPCAVVNSRMKLGWDTHLKDFLVQDELVSDFLQPFKSEISSAQEIFDRQIFMWCIENYVPLKQFAPQEIIVTFYENLCLAPEVEAGKIFTFIGLKPSFAIEGIVNRASTESREDSAINSGENLISSWRKSISERQIRRAVDILGLFGLDRIYDEGDLPLVSGEEALRIFPPPG